MIQMLIDHCNRLIRARRFRIPYIRRRSFRVPFRIVINSKLIALDCPPENGIGSDFLTCFVDDEYGLGCVGHPIYSILDLGANVGFFSMAARSFFPLATIHAYEPNPRSLEYCHKNVAQLDIVVHGEALGSQAGEVFIQDESDSNQVRTSINANSADSLAVPQITLGTAINRLGYDYVDLIKIDCEGAEWDLFTDPEPWKQIRFLRMEYHLWGLRRYEEVVSALSGLNFRITLHRSAGEWGTVWAENTSLRL
jgi:FkbM family methyltransferase